MDNQPESRPEDKGLSRRKFLGAGGAVMVSSALPAWGSDQGQPDQKPEKKPQTVRQYRTLGRTGFKASDISMGAPQGSDSSIFRYAYDHGINYFDTAESYGKGKAEKLLGEALKSMDREKVFVTTKVQLGDKDTEETVLERFGKCQERLQTKYVDALLMHSVSNPATINHQGFHSATKKLKAEGRLKYIGISCHGSWEKHFAGTEEVLCPAAEDGRFDLVLAVYNFMNKEAGEKVLAACKKKNVGTTAMKTAPGVLKVSPVDPDNLTEEQEEMVKRIQKWGKSREEAIERMKKRQVQLEDAQKKTQPFAKKYQIETEEQLRQISVQWVLQNPDMHTVCVGFGGFDAIDKMVSLSGKKLAQADAEFLEAFQLAYNNQYCRHACNLCAGKCPQDIPVSTIMRYAYYFECQQREKYAMGKYAALGSRDASGCAECGESCSGACPYGLDIQVNLIQAHKLLSLA